MKKVFQQKQCGMSIIQAIIGLILIGIVGVLAFLQYGKRNKTEKFSEVIASTTPYKTAMEKCFADQRNTFLPCTPGMNGVPRLPTYYSGRTANLAIKPVDQYHVSITATADVGTTLAGETYTIDGAAKVVNGKAVVDWSVNKVSTCVAAGVC